MTHVLASVLEFTDGTESVMLLSRGTIEECEAVAVRIPAVSYSGDKTIKESYLATIPSPEWDALQEGAA